MWWMHDVMFLMSVLYSHQFHWCWISLFLCHITLLCKTMPLFKAKSWKVFLFLTFYISIATDWKCRSWRESTSSWAITYNNTPTCPWKASIMNCRAWGWTHSIHFCTTWLPFWSLTHFNTWPSSSRTMSLWSEAITKLGQYCVTVLKLKDGYMHVK